MHRISYLAFLLVVVLASGCNAVPFAKASAPAAVELYGAGTGAGLDFMMALSDRFSALHPEVHIRLEDVGQDTAVAYVALGRAEFGFISRDLKTDEIGKVRPIRFAATGTGIAVNAGNTITGLTTNDVRRIFAGELTDWAQLGGAPGEIRPFLREQGSATRASFETWFFDGNPAYGSSVVAIANSGPMFQALHDFRTGIGMVTIQKASATDASIRMLAIDGVPANTNTVQSGAYPVRRPIILLLPPDAKTISTRLNEFLDFINSAEGQEIIAAF